MTNEPSGPTAGSPSAGFLASMPLPDRSPSSISTPHLATGFFLMAIVIASAVFIAGTMDSLVRLAGVAMVSVVVSMIIFWMVVAQPTMEMLAIARSRNEQERARSRSIQQDVHHATAQREQTAGRVGRLGTVLSSTHEQLAEEISGLGQIVGQLASEPDDDHRSSDLIERLQLGVDLVGEGQRNVAAIARLGTANRTDRIGPFRASDVAPIPVEATVVVDRDEEIYGDVDLWRLFVKNAARNAEVHGQASSFTISTGGGWLRLSDDGAGCSTRLLEQAWKTGLRPNGTRSDGMQIMRRVAEAHDGQVRLRSELDQGVTIEVDLRDMEIDLRSSRRLARPIRTPYKASGGRTTSMR